MAIDNKQLDWQQTAGGGVVALSSQATTTDASGQSQITATGVSGGTAVVRCILDSNPTVYGLTSINVESVRPDEMPFTAMQRNKFTTRGVMVDCVEKDGRIYVAAFADWLWIYNVENPNANPIRIKTFSRPGNYAGLVTTCVKIVGNYLYVCGRKGSNVDIVGESNGGLQIYDISDPDNATLVGSYMPLYTVGSTNNIFATCIDYFERGGRKYIVLSNSTSGALNSCGNAIIDVTNPNNPVVVHVANDFVNASSFGAVSCNAGTGLLVGGYSGFRITAFDVSDMSNWIQRNIIHSNNPLWPAGASTGSYHATGLADNLCIFALNSTFTNAQTAGNGIYIVDTSDLLNLVVKHAAIPKEDLPSLTASIAGPPYTVRIVRKAGRAYAILDCGYNIAVFNITDVANPLYCGVITTPQSNLGIYSLCFSEDLNTLYATEGNSTLSSGSTAYSIYNFELNWKI